jgi:alpha-galactosidase/6-phospho-beta-glucosidase family protein
MVVRYITYFVQRAAFNGVDYIATEARAGALRHMYVRRWIGGSIMYKL